MILIISNDKEKSTSDVIEWLLYYNVNFELISERNKIKNIKYTQNRNNLEVIIETNRSQINFKDITSYWYRRGGVTLKRNPLFNESRLKKGIDFFINQENGHVIDFIHYILKQKSISINSLFEINVNKNIMLSKASKIGLKIPETIVTNEKKKVLFFLEKHKRIITKSISNGTILLSSDYTVSNYTNEVTKESLLKIPDKFELSLFQKLLDKKYELRIFYLKGKFYSSAIFSQEDEQTKIDFRKYNFKKPNRVVPYKLPTKISDKLRNFMNNIKMSSGSLDMVVTTNDEYIFLEVNPVGLFEQVSEPCNYYLHEKIAKFLIN